MVSFNSQPRKGADRNSASDTSDTVVSTHSPARGLTNWETAPTIRFVFQLTAPQGG